MLNTWDGRQVVGHGGNTIGQSAYFQMVPDRNVAVALLTNLSGGAKQAETLLRTLLSELADVTMPPSPEPADLDVDLAPLTGEYQRYGVRTVVDTDDDGQLRLTLHNEGPIAAQMGMTEPIVTVLQPSSRDDTMLRFVGQLPNSDGAWTPVTFYGFEQDSRPRFLHIGARVSKRTG
jgi:hypothetical protein